MKNNIFMSSSMSYEPLRGPELSPLAPYYMGHCHPLLFHVIWYQVAIVCGKGRLRGTVTFRPVSLLSVTNIYYFTALVHTLMFAIPLNITSQQSCDSRQQLWQSIP